MSITLTIKCKVPNGLRTEFVLLSGSQLHAGIDSGSTVVEIETWLKIKSSYRELISNGAISVDQAEEQSAIQSFKKQCFSEFESIGIPSVKASVSKGELSTGVKYLFAIEWIESKEERRVSRKDAREEESLSISRKALQLSKEARDDAKRANIIAIVAVVFSIIVALVSGKFGK